LKLGKDKRAEKESLYLNERVIQNIFFVDRVLQGFDDYKLFRPCNDDVLLVDDFHVLYLRLNLSKEGEDDTVQPIVWPWVTHDEDSVGSLSLRGRPYNQIRFFLGF
jgi:hypothetical protein